MRKNVDMNIIKVLLNQQQQCYLYKIEYIPSKLKKWVYYVYDLNHLHHVSICSLTINLSI